MPLHLTYLNLCFDDFTSDLPQFMYRWLYIWPTSIHVQMTLHLTYLNLCTNDPTYNPSNYKHTPTNLSLCQQLDIQLIFLFSWVHSFISLMWELWAVLRFSLQCCILSYGSHTELWALLCRYSSVIMTVTLWCLNKLFWLKWHILASRIPSLNHWL